jgi:acetyl esterase/lipase
MRRVVFAIVLAVPVVALPVRSADDKPPVIGLWPDQAPGESGPIGEEKDTTKPTDGKVAGQRVIRLGNVSKPTITVYCPTKEKDTGTAVIVCPGGGYHILAMDLEGTEVCRWLNDLGITAVLLKYRVPGRKGKAPHQAALQDAQRAVSVVRSKAKDFGIDPARIGMLGFSAGGHLTAMTATNHAHRSYDAIDDSDKASRRPDFVVLVYPAYLLNTKKDALADNLPVTKETPPMFLAHASDDPIPAEGSAQLYLALKRAGVPAELHLYSTGGHGFGLRKTEKPCTAWPARCAEWLKQRGLLKKSG